MCGSVLLAATANRPTLIRLSTTQHIFSENYVKESKKRRDDKEYTVRVLLPSFEPYHGDFGDMFGMYLSFLPFNLLEALNAIHFQLSYL
jgi:hypothetical protein